MTKFTSVLFAAAAASALAACSTLPAATFPLAPSRPTEAEVSANFDAWNNALATKDPKTASPGKMVLALVHRATRRGKAGKLHHAGMRSAAPGKLCLTMIPAGVCALIFRDAASSQKTARPTDRRPLQAVSQQTLIPVTRH